MNAIHQNFARQGLVRPRDGRLFAGVCAGVAQRLGMDPWAVRALFVASMIVIPGSQIIAYPVLWVLMPEDATAAYPEPQAPGF